MIRSQLRSLDRDTESSPPMPNDKGQPDPILAEVFAQQDEQAREAAIHAVMTSYALPLVRQRLRSWVVRKTITETELPDLESEVTLRLFRKLRQLGEDPTAQPVARFADYIDATVHNALDNARRARDPLRSRLAIRIKYVMTHTSTLALWGRDPLLCGLAAFAGRFDAVAVAAPRGSISPACDNARELRAFIEDLLRQSGAPVPFEELVATLATALELPAEPFLPPDVLARRPEQIEPLARLEGRQYLDRLWEEIASLPVRQRRALMLQLRLDDGESVTRLLPALGIASVRALAASLEMPLGDLLALWNELPLMDQRIAGMLGITRQQVINLRKSARERLARRMGRARP